MITIKENRCDFCAACITVCPPDCIEVRESSIKIIDEHRVQRYGDDHPEVIAGESGSASASASPKETGIIKGSNKLTAFDLEGNFNPAFLNSFELLTKKNNKSSKVIFVSKEGDISSILSNGFVERLGYKNMFSLQGGIKEWILLELPLKK